MQTLEEPEEGREESRKSSTRHPGSISIKYSDMLLVEPTLSAAVATTVSESEIAGS